MPITRFVVPSTLLLALLLGPLLLPGAGVQVLFDPALPDVGPFPTDFLTVADLAQKTRLRVNLPLPDCGQEPSSCEELGLINELDGFNIQPRIGVRFSGRVDVDTLRQGVSFVWLDDPTGESAGLRPTGHVTGINQVIYDPETDTAYAKPDEMFDQHRRYLLLVTEAVRDLAGDPVEADGAFLNCVEQPGQSDYCLQLAGALNAASVPDRIVAASIFTTLSATAWLEKARGQLRNAPINFQRTGTNNVFRLTNLLAVTWRMQVGVNPPSFSDFTVPLPSALLPTVDRMAFGSFQSPSFLNDDGLIPTTPTDDEVVPPVVSEEIFFHAFLPSSPMPASGFPVVIFGHGINDSRFGAPTLVSASFAGAGFATLAMHAVGHGVGPESRFRLLETNGRINDLPAPGRGSDLDGDGAIGSREGCLILAPFAFALRDCARQTALDLIQLVRAIRAGIDIDGDGQVDLDGDRIYYAGQSLGGIYGTLLNALEPDIRAAVLNVGGGSIVDTARWSPGFRSQLRDVLAARVPPLLGPDDPLDENYVLRDQPAKINLVAGAIEKQNVIERYEWLQGTGDPLFYAPHLQSLPLRGVPAKPVLWQFARGDQTVPNPQNSGLIRAADMREKSSLYRHDLARSEAPDLEENPHGFLVDIRTTEGSAIAAAAQQQMTGFLTSDGTTIPDVNLPLRLLFGVDLFETPDPLPEDLGFASPLASVSAASFEAGTAAAESIASAFGQGLATRIDQAVSTPLPTELAGTTVRVVDSAGAERFAPLFFVSPGQINYLIPAGAAPGPATVTVLSEDSLVSSGTIQIESVAPGLFSANANGRGVAAAIVQRLSADGSQSFEPVASGGPAGTQVALPIDLRPETDQVFLLLFGTGIRGRPQLSSVVARIGGEEVNVLFAGPQGEFVGLDQVNLGPLPSSLAGRGEVDIELSVGGAPANVVTISIR